MLSQKYVDKKKPNKDGYIHFKSESEFAKDINFPDKCSFGKGCRFGEGCSFGEWCSFGKVCRFGERCSFGKVCSFGEWCRFGELCSFGEGCSFEEISEYIGKYPYLLFSGFSKLYIYNLKKGIYVRAGCFFGTLKEFRKRVIKEYSRSHEYISLIKIAEAKFIEWNN